MMRIRGQVKHVYQNQYGHLEHQREKKTHPKTLFLVYNNLMFVNVRFSYNKVIFFIRPI